MMGIRKRYGIGIRQAEETQSVTDSLKDVIGRSLESLSNELYNKDMLFVLELIQNSDDNEYAISGEDDYLHEPSLVFLIEPHRIALFNDEVGFLAKHMSAIFDVKAPIKGKHQCGYIGRKVIKFKH